MLILEDTHHKHEAWVDLSLVDHVASEKDGETSYGESAEPGNSLAYGGDEG